MPGFPLTAWALRHPWGTHADAVLDRLRDPPPPELGPPTPAAALATALLDELADPCARACARWGTSRVAMIFGSAAPTDERSLDRMSTMLALVRSGTSIAGPAYHVVATGVGGAKAIASADRLLRASLVDAVLVGGADDGDAAMLLVERHGDAFVELRASAEASGVTDLERFDEAAAERTVTAAWAARGRPPLGYVHAHADANGRHAEAERRMLRALVGAVPCCSTASSSGTGASTGASSTGAAAGAVDAVLAAASLVRGYTPEASPRELEHDRVLLHGFSPGGHHVALLLEARS